MSEALSAMRAALLSGPFHRQRGARRGL